MYCYHITSVLIYHIIPKLNALNKIINYRLAFVAVRFQWRLKWGNRTSVLCVFDSSLFNSSGAMWMKAHYSTMIATMSKLFCLYRTFILQFLKISLNGMATKLTLSFHGIHFTVLKNQKIMLQIHVFCMIEYIHVWLCRIHIYILYIYIYTYYIYTYIYKGLAIFYT